LTGSRRAARERKDRFSRVDVVSSVDSMAWRGVASVLLFSLIDG